jgi:ribosomal protein S12 methylthiotransferase accessory factor
MPALDLGGSHRVRSADATLAEIAPKLRGIGITRCADVTGLDRLGIPVFCAIRPTASLLQIANGKGLEPSHARVSALMESIEHLHAELPPARLRCASIAELRSGGEYHVEPAAMPSYGSGVHYTDRTLQDWLPGRHLVTGEVGWLPASAFWIGEPQLTAFSSNGLASGNTPDEAVVHGTLEVLERDAIARLSAGGMSAARLAPCAVDLATIDEPRVAGLVDRLRTAGVDLVLMRVPSQVAVHTMWAVLLDPRSPLACSRVNLGQGAHLSPATAAIRAITEAAQSRLTFIHGAREDLATDSYGHDASHDRLIDFFAGLEPSLDWRDLPDRATGEVAGDRRLLATMLADAPLGDAFTVDLTRADIGISVAKTVIPGAWYRQGFFVRRGN